MQHQEFEPPAELRDTIKCFWHNSGDFGEQQASFRVVPDGYAEIIFYFGQLRGISPQGDRQVLPSPFLVGLLHQPVFFQAIGRLDILGVRCFPWTVFELLGLPAAQGGVRIVEHGIAQLQAPLAASMRAGHLAEALAQLVRYFQQTRRQLVSDRLLVRAGAAMHAAHGTLPVSQLAAAAHATVRTLERRFKQAAGHTLKDVSGLMRFEQARNHLWAHPAANLAGLAQELGYADQAHLSREFKRYSGTTPAAFARYARQGQQAFDTDFVAFIQA